MYCLFLPEQQMTEALLSSRNLFVIMKNCPVICKESNNLKEAAYSFVYVQIPCLVHEYFIFLFMLKMFVV